MWSPKLAQSEAESSNFSKFSWGYGFWKSYAYIDGALGEGQRISILPVGMNDLSLYLMKQTMLEKTKCFQNPIQMNFFFIFKW